MKVLMKKRIEKAVEQAKAQALAREDEERNVLNPFELEPPKPRFASLRAYMEYQQKVR